MSDPREQIRSYRDLRVWQEAMNLAEMKAGVEKAMKH